MVSVIQSRFNYRAGGARGVRGKVGGERGSAGGARVLLITPS